MPMTCRRRVEKYKDVFFARYEEIYIPVKTWIPRETEPGVDRAFRVIYVIPGEDDGISMIFAIRLTRALHRIGVTGKSFFLRSRTSLLVLGKEWKRIKKEIQSFHPDLIHAQFGTVSAMFCVVAAKIPTVVTYYGSDLNPDPSVFWIRSAVGRLLSQVAALRVRRIICVSNQLKERLWWRKNRATVIPTGVDTGIFYPRSQDDVRSELGWKKEERIVLFNAGRTPILKRFSLAQSAVSVAKSIYGKIRLEVLDGYVDARRIPAMMNGADCLLLTSDWEGSPTVVQEALACNLPIVSVDVGDVRERLRRVWPSKIVDRDPNEIGKALAEILMCKDRSNGWYAVQHLSLDKIALHTLAVYQEAIRI